MSNDRDTEDNDEEEEYNASEALEEEIWGHLEVMWFLFVSWRFPLLLLVQ
jgi:hypothetical protein